MKKEHSNIGAIQENAPCTGHTKKYSKTMQLLSYHRNTLLLFFVS